MTRDDIIRIAETAGWTGPKENVTYVAMLERFAELVAAALAQPEPKPHGYLWFTHYMEQRFTHRMPEESERIGDVKPIYTAPPQREWVGLTPKERDELVLRAGALLDHIYEYGTISEGIAPRLKSLFTAVEAKLKEKNT
jgi:hypothetical protein